MGLRAGPAAVLGHFDLHAGNARAGERIGIGATPELAVGDHLQTDVFLQLDHAGDGLVFDFAQRLAIEFAGRVPLACAQEFARAHQAADMFGAEGRRSHHSCTPRRGRS